MKFIIAAITLATSSLALAYHCPNEMKAIDAKLATNPTLSAADMGKVKELRAEGEKDRKSTRLNSSHIQKSRMPSSA